MSCPVRPAGHYVSVLSIRPSHLKNNILWAAQLSYKNMAIHRWCRCAPPILFLTLTSKTWFFSINLHWGVTLCAALSKSYDFQHIIMHVCQCPQDVEVYLVFCFDVNLYLTCSQGHVFKRLNYGKYWYDMNTHKKHGEIKQHSVKTFHVYSYI